MTKDIGALFEQQFGGERIFVDSSSRAGGCQSGNKNRDRQITSQGRSRKTLPPQVMAMKRSKAAKKMLRSGTFPGGMPVKLLPGALHPNSIMGLKPAKRWTIVSDETGTCFGNAAFESGDSRGRYAMVLIPDGARLPKLQPGWHAVDKFLDEQLRVAGNLQKSKCGIVGVSVTNLQPTNRNLWFACIESLLDIVLRTLPINGDTEIALNVEQCGDRCENSNSMLDRTLDTVMYHLSLNDPARAKQIKLTGRFVAKEQCPYNGYADLVAYSWGCSKDVRRIFREFGWVGPCLVADDPVVSAAFRKCLTIVQQNEVLSMEDWIALVTSDHASTPDSLVCALLRAFGEEAQSDVEVWRKYLDYTVAHLDSKSIKLSVLKKQIDWLEKYEPKGESLPPRLRLLWLSTRLAASNHRGGTCFGSTCHEREFVELKKVLKDEDAPLTCFADLHLAVEMTDRFEFEAARMLLMPWLDEPVAVPGLRYHGQVLSSLGQHEAFLGSNEKALEYFGRAIAVFESLSEHSQSEIDHTLAYAVIAAMDAKSPCLNELLATYLYGGVYSVETMVDMSNKFASVGEDEHNSKYAHAIFLRHLVTLPADDRIRTAYLAQVANWKWSTDGHPWELIAFYRAILLGASHRDYRLWLRRGYDLAKSGGPTLKLIALVIGAGLIGTAADSLSATEYQSLLDGVIESLPALGAHRIEVLRSAISSPQSTLSMAGEVLPFNFR